MPKPGLQHILRLWLISHDEVARVSAGHYCSQTRAEGKMSPELRERVAAQIDWLQSEISDCERQGFGHGHPDAKRYLSMLRVYLTEWRSIRDRDSLD